jgi:hypothetical protein
LVFLLRSRSLNGFRVDAFVFKANDGSFYSGIETISLTIDALNDAPANTVPLARSIEKDTALGAANNAVYLSQHDFAGGRGRCAAADESRRADVDCRWCPRRAVIGFHTS